MLPLGTRDIARRPAAVRTVFGWQRHRAARRGLVGARSGSVTAIQRFGGALNANVPFHALLFDGVYTRATPTARPRFHRLPPPTDAGAPSPSPTDRPSPFGFTASPFGDTGGARDA